MRPNFLYIGLPKSGSTWLYEAFRAHPDIFVPQAKDLYFFDKYYSRGMAWYEANFAAAAGERIVADISHDYLFSAEAAARMRADLGPDVILGVILRNPYEYILSQYLYIRRSGYTQLPFREALDAFPYLLDTCDYARHLGPYLEQFGRERIKIWLFDDLRGDAESFARTIHADLGVAHHPGHDYSPVRREAAEARSFLVAKAVRMAAKLARHIRLHKLVGAIKHSRVNSLLYRPMAAKPVLDAADVALLQPELDRCITATGERLGMQLDHWRRGP